MRIKRLIISYVFLISLALLFSSVSFAENNSNLLNMGERITNYQSDITINSDSSMTVRETISVIALGDQIKRGIYRDFPTTYYDEYENKYIVDFKVLEVLRDGNIEPYKVESIKNGKRIYIGDPDIYLDPGRYTYTIVYYTNRQLGFFKDHDELYWNVTGNLWDFPIDRATARVTLPSDVQKGSIKTEAYTGYVYSKGKDYFDTVDENSKAFFSTTRPLKQGEGLTIVVGWPKGFVSEPTAEQKLLYFLKDNVSAIFGVIFILFIFMYYLIMWAIYGRDPKRGTIIPLYEPPNGLSPAGVRYISRMGFDKKTLTAAIINMAVKGYLKIHDYGSNGFSDNDRYMLTKTGSYNANLTPEEDTIQQVLFRGDSGIMLTNQVAERLMSAISNGEKVLKKGFENIYFTTNFKYFYLGCVISIIGIILDLIIGAVHNQELIFLTIWVTFWSIGVATLILNSVNTWKKAIKGEKLKLFSALFTTAFAIPFVIGEIVGIVMMIVKGGTIVATMILLSAAINAIFWYLLKAYTVEGRKVMDSIEGFKLFLKVAEKDRLNYEFPVDKTPELFEKYLPYALALDVEQEWSEQFADVFASISNGQGGYVPVWYSGDIGNFSGITDFTSSVSSSFDSAISSSSTPPGSSSGGGGGGSSGGGGGGGGGGGW